MLETIALGPDLDQKRKTFFGLLFGNARGLLCIAYIDKEDKKKYGETFYKYPEQVDEAIEDINKHMEQNIYFCPQLFRERKRVKENVEFTPNVWSDLDYCNPDNLLLEPTCVIESSPGRYQGYWVLDDKYDPDDVENIAQRIAYRHADEGADRSGWDLTQLLRIPYTYNYKYDPPVIVKPVFAKRNQYALTDFDVDYNPVDNYLRVDTPLPTEIDRTKSAEDLLQEARMKLNPIIWPMFTELPDDTKWSQVLWKLMLTLYENGFTRDQVYIISEAAACNKYARDGRPAHQLWKDVCRAELKIQLHDKLAFVDATETHPIELMTEEERLRVKQSPDTFLERYIEWASGLGDAAVQYHQAGALVALASVLCGSIRLPTSFGTVVPNLWFMILADTTLTRKTTAMDIAMDLVENVDDDIVLATDGSIEGMLTSLSLRPNRPSVFLRDEFAGLIEQMNRKDYMSGMPELLTKLYDGKMQKRVLRRETIEVKSPRLIVFAGGIKDAVTEAFGVEHIQSGFIPRFIFITAESDISKVKPVGPPNMQNQERKEKILIELMKLHEWYNRTEDVYIDENTSLTQKKFFDCTMTDDAWVRYNKLESQLVNFGVESFRPDLMTPVGDRLAKSILKTAILLAASRQFENDLVIEELDILRAIKYGEIWFTHTRAIINRVGMGGSERMLEKILGRIKAVGEMPRSHIMQMFRLDVRNYNLLMDTLEYRGLVIRTKTTRGENVRVTKSGENEFL